MGLLVMMIVAILVGLAAWKMTKEGIPGGLAGYWIMALAGAWLGKFTLGSWNIMSVAYGLPPLLIGAVAFISILTVLARLTSRSA